MSWKKYPPLVSGRDYVHSFDQTFVINHLELMFIGRWFYTHIGAFQDKGWEPLT